MKVKSRELLEAFKFLSVREVYSVLTKVNKLWREHAFSEDILAHFLQFEDTPHHPSADKYTRLRILHWTIDKPDFVLSLAGGLAQVWDLRSPGQKPKSWTNEAFINSARYALISHHEVVVTGGTTTLKRATLLDVEHGAVKKLPALLQARAWHGTIAFQGRVYIAGGDVKGTILKSAEMYDGGQWVRLAEMVTARYNLTLSTFKGKIYAFGGSDQNYLKSVEVYDGFVWALAPMELPTPRNYPTIVRARGTLYLVGGYEPRNAQRYLHVWDEAACTWTQLAACGADYSLSNAASVKQNSTLYLLDHKSYQLAMSVTS